ncbi:MAG: hypothetical protein DLM63_09345 [Solirubrobacterales bacterium]|nr:MAG: hypothetical protein DLM63_09345 [Solirubrobacterales bacterium]
MGPRQRYHEEQQLSEGDLAAEVASVPWYHTLELPGGIVTPGEYDARRTARRLPLPESFAGRRCLDVGMHDGFWAFELERRGAAEVIGIDLDDPRQFDWSEPTPQISQAAFDERQDRLRPFAIAKRALGSQVERRIVSVYDLDQEAIGLFDFAFIGTLLLHLRDPIRALTAIRNVLRPGGELLVNDVITLRDTLLRRGAALAHISLVPGAPFWWIPNLAGLRMYVRKAGFEVAASAGPLFVDNGRGGHVPREHGLVLRWLGMPHGWVLGRVSR